LPSVHVGGSSPGGWLKPGSPGRPQILSSPDVGGSSPGRWVRSGTARHPNLLPFAAGILAGNAIIPDDPSVYWEQADIEAINIGGDVWHSGCARDVIVTQRNKIVVASDTGGAWEVHLDGTARSLSNDWDNPDLTCLALGPDGQQGDHVFAGGTSLYETDPQAHDPLARWTEIGPISAPSKFFLEADGTPLLVASGQIRRMVVLPSNPLEVGGLGSTRMIVLACQNGVFWSVIAPLGQPRIYTWHLALFSRGPEFTGETGVGDGAFDIVAGPGGTIVVSAFNFAGVDGWFGIFSATAVPDPNSFVLNASTITAADGSAYTIPGDAPPETAISLAASTDALTMYAAVSTNDSATPDGAPGAPLRSILVSTDGGVSWKEVSSIVPPLLADASGKVTIFTTTRNPDGSIKDFPSGGQGNHRTRATNCMAVDPDDPKRVLLGWKLLFESTNAGVMWRDIDTNVLHSDYRAIRFAQIDKMDGSGPVSTMLVCNDGGVFMTTDAKEWTSILNKELFTLQFRGPYVDASSWRAGLVAGGTLDNGVLYAYLHDAHPNWIQGRDGDGDLVCIADVWPGFHDIQSDTLPTLLFYSVNDGFHHDGHILHSVRFQHNSRAPDHPPGEENWYLRDIFGGLAFMGSFVIDRPPLPTGVVGYGAKYLVAVAGGQAKYDWGFQAQNRDDVQPIVLKKRIVAGVYATMGGSVQGGLAKIAEVPPSGTSDDETITAIVAPSQSEIYVGTSRGAIWMYDGSSSFEGTSIGLISNAPIGLTPQVSAFAFVANVGFATYNYPDRDENLVAGFVVRYGDIFGAEWSPVTGLPNEGFYGLAISNNEVWVATDSSVYVSRDFGNTWAGASRGLPARPHCRGLRFIQEANGHGYLYLSTNGRSLWKVDLGGAPEWVNVKFNSPPWPRLG
jgi:hypothetical protein